MLVTIHGPNLTDSSEGTYRVHADDSPENDREVKLNGSLHPETLDVASREDVINHVYPEAPGEAREPEDLKIYFADVHFGESCETLPREAENPNEGEHMPYTAEEKAEALKVYAAKGSYSAVAKALGKKSPTTAKKIVEEAQAEVAAATPEPRTRRSMASVGAKVDPNAMVPCRFCRDEKGHSIEHPLTTDHWYVNKATGELHSSARCKKSERIYRQERKAAKEAAGQEAKAASAQPAPEAPETAETDERHLTAVA